MGKITGEAIIRVRRKLEKTITDFEWAHKRATDYQKHHPGVYIEIFGDKNLKEPIDELKSINQTLETWEKKLDLGEGGDQWQS